MTADPLAMLAHPVDPITDRYARLAAPAPGSPVLDTNIRRSDHDLSGSPVGVIRHADRQRP
jgi:hypothetical protein